MHWRNNFKILWQYHHKHLTLSTPPKIMTVEVTNACNLNCLWCAREATKKRGIGYMTYPTFERILEYCQQVGQRSLQLFMHGESTLHPTLIHFMRAAQKRGISTTFTTNGTKVNRAYAQKLLAAGLRSICFSFEGTSKEAYETIRVGADYKTVKNNILDFWVENAKHGNNCRIKLSILDCEYTHDDIPKFVEHWQEIVDDIIVVPLHDWGGVLNKNVHIEGRHPPEVCFFPWYGLAVYWNGDVSPCCMYEGNPQLGNINKQDIMAIWNGEAYQDFRRRMLHDRDSLPICRECQENFFRLHPIYKHINKPNRWFPADRTGLRLASKGLKALVT